MDAGDAAPGRRSVSDSDDQEAPIGMKADDVLLASIQQAAATMPVEVISSGSIPWVT